jgi:tRNA pseudouridine65 synthase
MKERLDILYQDGDIVAVHKPAGMLVHRTDIARDHRWVVLQLLRDQLRHHIYPVHRLDRPVSGLLLFALERDCAQRLVEQFTAGEVGKDYVAVVRGHTAEWGVIDRPLAEKPGRDGGWRSLEPRPARDAVTEYRRLATVELPVAAGPYATSRYSLLEVSPHTGRMHQIRRHLKHIAHPLVGDTTYGDGRHNEVFRQHLDCSRLLLAATSLSFRHPRDGREITLTAPLADDFANVIARLGWVDPTRGDHSALDSGLQLARAIPWPQ